MSTQQNRLSMTAQWGLIATIVLLTTTLASAQSYTYQMIDVPFANNGTKVMGLTDKGILAGTYWSQGSERGWLYDSKTKKYTTVNGPGGVALQIMDVTPTLRVTDTYWKGSKRVGFTKSGSTFTTIDDPVITSIYDCSISPMSGIIACNYDGPTINGSSPYGAAFLYKVSAKTIVAWLEISGAMGMGVSGLNNDEELVGTISVQPPGGRAPMGAAGRRWPISCGQATTAGRSASSCRRSSSARRSTGRWSPTTTAWHGTTCSRRRPTASTLKRGMVYSCKLGQEIVGLCHSR
jgi:hypothetical protein